MRRANDRDRSALPAGSGPRGSGPRCGVAQLAERALLDLAHAFCADPVVLGEVAQRLRRASKTVTGAQDRALAFIEAPDEVGQVEAVRPILDALVRLLGLRVGDQVPDRGGLVVKERLIQAARRALADEQPLDLLAREPRRRDELSERWLALMSLMMLAVGVVNLRTNKSPSKNSVAMSVLFRRFFMSLFVRESSSTFDWSS